MAAYEKLSRQFTDKKGKVHEITADDYGSVTARSGKIRTGGLEVMLNFHSEKKQQEHGLRGRHMIYGIATHGRYKRRGIASAMYKLAEEKYGPIDIGRTSEEGGAWRKSIEG